MFLPEKNKSEELQLVAKNDEHHGAMTGDNEFMAQVKERNAEANQLMNLNNAALTQAGTNAAQNAEVLVKHDKESEDWINKKWRPAMGWMYMAVCVTDFIIFPIAWSVLQAATNGSVTTPWQPISLQGGMYMLVCMFDMIVFPVLWSLLQTMTHTPITQWNPLTLQGAGLFHIAMGAVLGIAAYGRTKEKIEGAANVDTAVGAPAGPASAFLGK